MHVFYPGLCAWFDLHFAKGKGMSNGMCSREVASPWDEAMMVYPLHGHLFCSLSGTPC